MEQYSHPVLRRVRLRSFVALLSATFGLVLLTRTALPGGGGASLTALATAGLTTATALLLFALAGALGGRRKLREALLTGRGRPLPGAAGTALAVAGMLGLSQLLDALLELSGARAGSRLAAIDEAVRGAGAPELALAVLGLALAPAIAEEILFRGLLFRSFSRLGGLPAAIFGTSLLFGISHMEVAQGGAAFVLGLYLGLIVAVTGSVRTAVLCHLGNNLLALSAALLAAGIPHASPTGTALLAALSVAFLLTAGRLARELPRAADRWRTGGGQDADWDRAR